jgi:uncharacterized protein YjbI with pentapeptide repeats
MANAAQLEILKQGVEVWNQWRKDHPDEKIDLRGGFEQSVLLQRILPGINLREAHLPGVFLRGADLQGADLQGADLREASLIGVNLVKANLVEVDLVGADLRGANLEMANLQGADLQNANMAKACFYKADLEMANLEGARLTETIFKEAYLTGVYLYETGRDNWKIDGIKCNYVYFIQQPIGFWNFPARKRKQWELEHRIPQNRDFRPGEFEELYKQLPTFEYVFEHGFTPLDAAVMDRIVQAINAQHPEFNLVLKNFEVTGTPHATFTVLHKEQVEAAQSQVATSYERRILQLEAQKEQLMDVIKMLGSGGVKLQAVTDGGITIQPALPTSVKQAIVAFLITIPNIQDHRAQQAFLQSAGLDDILLAQLPVNEPPKPFMELLVTSCVSYGQLTDGRHALIAVLEAAQQLVGIDRQAEADALIQQIVAHAP